MIVAQDINTDPTTTVKDAVDGSNVNGSETAAIIQDTVASDPVAAQTAATVEVTDDSIMQETTDNANSNDIIGWIAIAIAVVAGFIAWKLVDNLSKELKALRARQNRAEDIIDNLTSKAEYLSEKLEALTIKVNSAPRPTVNIQQPPYHPNPTTPPAAYGGNANREPRKFHNSANVTKYATLQSPDENGTLRFSERSMSEAPSPQKMFLLEINPQTGTGTYRINPTALGTIISDLQMFKDFVKPFTFSGNPSSASIRDKKPGKISKSGNFWVVEERLEITIN